MKKIYLVIAIILFGLSSYSMDLELENFNPDKTPETKNSYEDVSSQARIMYAQNNIDEAMNILINIPQDSRSAENWLLLGNIQQDKGNINEAKLMYEYAIMENPKAYKAYYNLGVLYFGEEKYSLALENFKKAQKYKNDLAIIYYNIGCTYINMGEFKKARNELLYAIELKGTEPDYYYNLALCYKKLNNEKKAKYYLDIREKVLANKV